ncbi:MAG TPA: gephyrin-like molybdotransferase Glp [Acetobacteraceae bacterium]|jgi:molybdopterin molybdotransferase
MITVDEARTRILAGLRPTGAEIVPLADAWRRVTAAPIVSRVTQPPQDVSAMDGYAVRAADGTLGAVLHVVGSAPAGHPWAGTLQPGEAVRLFTGSIMPQGTDSVLLQEDATRDGDRVTVNDPVTPRRHVRAVGQDFGTGDVLIQAGVRLNARHIGLIAAANHPWVTVRRRPVIAIMATGDEIALPGEPIPPGGIVSSNSHALATLVTAVGGEPMVLPVAPDDRAAIADASDAAAKADMLVTAGGASVGEHDLVQSALCDRGLTLDFWKIAMRPGKPLMFGSLGQIPLLGLPGNPVSSLVTAILFLAPAIGRLSGLANEPLPVSQALLGAPLKANDHRADHLRAKLAIAEDGSVTATAFSRQDSGMLRLLVDADALILRAPEAPALEAGATVSIIRLDMFGI